MLDETPEERAQRLIRAIDTVVRFADVHLKDGLPRRGWLAWSASNRPDGAWHFWLVSDRPGSIAAGDVEIFLHALCSGETPALVAWPSAPMPKLDSPYIVAVPEGPRNGHGLWEIQNRRSGDPLGGVFWYSRWRQYVFIPASVDVVLSADCLEALAQFIHEATP